MKATIKLAFIFLSLLAAATVVAPAAAQEKHQSSEEELHPAFRLGVFGGYSMNFHMTTSNIFDCPTCGAFNDGTGSGMSIEFFGEHELYGSLLDGVVGLGYAQRGGSFGETVTSDLPVLDPATNRYVPLKRKHTYTASLGYLVGDLGVKLTPLAEYPFYLRAGAAINLALSKAATYEQRENILSPNGVLYPENNTTERLDGAGDIPGVNSPISVIGGAGYPFHMGPFLTASPEVRYVMPLGQVTSQRDWKVSALEAGVAFRYDFYSIPEEERTKTSLPPSVVERSKPTMPSVALGTMNTKDVDILETIVTETFPILPYVFFDSASTVLPARYLQIGVDDRDHFNERSLSHHSLDAYYNILNVLGSRMSQNGATHITLSGTTDGRESSNDAAKQLALTRAQQVKDYLTTVWNIAPERIETKYLPSPTFPSSEEYNEGYEENRRVEISSSDDNLLKPLLHERYREHAVSPRSIPFKLAGASRSGIASWKLSVSAEGAPVWETFGKGAPPAQVEWQFDQHAASVMGEHLFGKDSLRCELTVTGNDNGSATSRYVVKANKEVNPFELSRLSLIVFDFDKADITPQNERMISQFVAKSIFPTSTSEITGSTDNLGEAKHNQKLSEDRAYAVRDVVLKYKPDVKIASTKGVGPQLKYPNETPEGRYYCRTVTVEVKTPIEDVHP